MVNLQKQKTQIMDIPVPENQDFN